MIRFASVIVLFVGMLPNLHGGIIEHDFQLPGDGLLTYDDVTHREWLDLTETTGWNHARIQESLLPGGALSGFTLAKLADVQEFVGSPTVPGLAEVVNLPFDGVRAWNVILLVGGEVESGPYGPDGYDLEDPSFDDVIVIGWEPIFRFAYGTAVANNSEDQASRVNISLLASTILPYYDWTTPGSANGFLSYNSFTGQDTGPYWLYRSVPEPTVMTLSLIGSVVFIACYRGNSRASH